MFRRYARPLVAAAALLLACTTDQPTQQSPALTPQVGAAVPCLSADSIRSLIAAVFDDSDRVTATGRFNDVESLVTRPAPDTAQARTIAFSLADFTLTKFKAGQLIGGQDPATQAIVTELLNALLCFVGLDSDIPDDALGPGGVVVILDPTSPDTLVSVPQQTAAVFVPATSVPQTTIVSISPLPNSPGPLLTGFDQYPLFYEYNASPNVTFNLDLVVGVCFNTGTAAPDSSRLRLAHNVPHGAPTGIEVLALAPVPFLDCSNLDSDAAINATGGVGGTTKNFSPFGTIDTLGSIAANSPASQVGKIGLPVVSPPSVKVTSASGAPMAGVTVTFQVTSGGGSVTGATQVTNASGIATVGSWILGNTPGTNTLSATATTVTGTGLTNNPLAFTAIGDRAGRRR